MFLGGAQSVLPANFNKAESSLRLIWHTGLACVGAKCIQKKSPGSECVKNPFTTWRPTKKLVSASQSDSRAPLPRAQLQRRGLRVDNLLPSPATCRPPHCLRVPHPKSALTVTLQPENEPRSLGLALPSSIKAWGFYLLTCARLCRQKRERCSPTPSLHLYKSSAHSLSSQQSTSQLLPFEYKGPSKRKRHLARAFQIKTVQQIFVWKCSKMRFNTLKKQRGDISSYTPST